MPNSRQFSRPPPHAPPLCALRARGDTKAMNPERIPVAAAPAALAGSRRVLIVDDHAPTVAAIRALLEREYPRIEVVGAASDGGTALRLIRATAPDIVVLDLNLGDEYGLDLMPEIGLYPGIAVIILTASDDVLARTRALAAGAAAFISKLSPASELIAAILATQSGSG